MSSVEELVPLGNIGHPQRLPILSFVVRHPQSGLLLHHNFVCAVLNDVFGVQARGGCACAGPYAQDLLGIDEDLAQRYEKLLVEDSRLDRSHLRRHMEHSDVEVLRPGFVRLNLSYSASEEQVRTFAIKEWHHTGHLSPNCWLFSLAVGQVEQQKPKTHSWQKWKTVVLTEEHNVTNFHSSQVTRFLLFCCPALISCQQKQPIIGRNVCSV